MGARPLFVGTVFKYPCLNFPHARGETGRGHQIRERSARRDSEDGGTGALCNNAEQHWNHSFYWKSLSPKGGGEPRGPVANAIKKGFGNFDAFKKKFSEIAG